MPAVSRFKKEEDTFIMSDLLPIFVEGQVEKKVTWAHTDCITKFLAKFPVPPDLSESEAGTLNYHCIAVHQING